MRSQNQTHAHKLLGGHETWFAIKRTVKELWEQQLSFKTDMKRWKGEDEQMRRGEISSLPPGFRLSASVDTAPTRSSVRVLIWDRVAPSVSTTHTYCTWLMCVWTGSQSCRAGLLLRFGLIRNVLNTVLSVVLCNGSSPTHNVVNCKAMSVLILYVFNWNVVAFTLIIHFRDKKKRWGENRVDGNFTATDF